MNAKVSICSDVGLERKFFLSKVLKDVKATSFVCSRATVIKVFCINFTSRLHLHSRITHKGTSK